MDLTLSADQEAVRDAIRDVLREQASSERLRRVMEAPDGFDARLWGMAAELGWLGLSLPEAAGGAGYGLPEAMILFTELGRSLAPGPWLGTVLAAESGAQGALAGRERVALVDDPRDALGAGAAVGGEASGVIDAAGATAFLVLGSREVRWVPGAGVEVASSHCIDPTRRMARVRFARTKAEVLAGEAARTRARGTVLAAAEAAGVAERAVEMSVDYAKVREQFGRPIGSFQAIKHRCADMAVRAEVARSAVTYAAVALEEGAEDAPLWVHVAKSLAGEAAVANTADGIQNHGGIGYTWEADPHLYLKRARLLEHVFGNRTEHLDAIAAPWRQAR